MNESNYYLITIVIASLTVIVTAISVWMSNKAKKRPVYFSQLELVYSPLFKILAPTLYQMPNKETVADFLSLASNVIDCNYFLCYPELIDLCNKLKNVINNNQDFSNEFMNLTHHIDICYDKLCRKSYLPVRDIFFRLNKNQFYNKSHKIDYIIRLIIYTILQIIVGIFLVVAVFALLIALFQLTDKLPRG